MGEDTEVLILSSIADPDQICLSVSGRCETLGISRSTWYRHLEDPVFKARASAAYRQLGQDYLGPVMDVLVKSALILGKDGHPDRKLYLELLGEYEPGQKLSVEAAKPKGAEALSDQELLAAFEGREELLPVGVRRRLGIEPKLKEESNGQET